MSRGAEQTANNKHKKINKYMNKHSAPLVSAD